MKTTVADAISYKYALERLTDKISSSKQRGVLKSAAKSIGWQLYRDFQWRDTEGNEHLIATNPNILQATIFLSFTEFQIENIIKYLPEMLDEYFKTAHANWGWSKADSVVMDLFIIRNRLMAPVESTT